MFFPGSARTEMANSRAPEHPLAISTSYIVVSYTYRQEKKKEVRDRLVFSFYRFREISPSSLIITSQVSGASFRVYRVAIACLA